MKTFRKNLLTAVMVGMLAIGGAACGGDDGGEAETGATEGAGTTTDTATEGAGAATEGAADMATEGAADMATEATEG